MALIMPKGNDLITVAYFKISALVIQNRRHYTPLGDFAEQVFFRLLLAIFVAVPTFDLHASSVPAPVKAALVTFTPQLAQPSHNLRRIENLTKTALSQGAKFVVFPELSLSGYFIEHPETLALSVVEPAFLSQSVLGKLAQEHQAVVVLGFAERGLDGLYNSAAIFFPDSSMKVVRKRTSLEGWSKAGVSDVQVFQSPYGSFSVLICAEIYHPSLSYIAAVKGAELLIVPANWWGPNGGAVLEYWRARALENSLWLFLANRKGTERFVNQAGKNVDIDMSNSRSAAISPTGEVLLDGIDIGIYSDEISYVEYLVGPKKETLESPSRVNSAIVLPVPPYSKDDNRNQLTITVDTTNQANAGVENFDLTDKKGKDILTVLSPRASSSQICVGSRECHIFDWPDSSGNLRQILFARSDEEQMWHVIPLLDQSISSRSLGGSRSLPLFEIGGLRFGVVDACDAVSPTVVSSYKNAGAHLLIVQFSPPVTCRVPFRSVELRESSFRFAAATMGALHVIVVGGEGSAFASIKGYKYSSMLDVNISFGKFRADIDLFEKRSRSTISEGDERILFSSRE